MTIFEPQSTSIPGVFLVTPFYAEDPRGHFIKSFEKDLFRKNGFPIEMAECFESFSQRNVLRGLHFLTAPYSQAKTIRALTGTVFDVVVDLRKNSPMYKKWEGYFLSAETPTMLFMPEGCAHGYVVLSQEAIVLYQCFSKYDSASDTGILWNDPTIDIKWPVEHPDQLIISERDLVLPTFAAFEPNNPF